MRLGTVNITLRIPEETRNLNHDVLQKGCTPKKPRFREIRLSEKLLSIRMQVEREAEFSVAGTTSIRRAMDS